MQMKKHRFRIKLPGCPSWQQQKKTNKYVYIKYVLIFWYIKKKKKKKCNDISQEIRCRRDKEGVQIFFIDTSNLEGSH